jgi:hypothetical protein
MDKHALVVPQIAQFVGLYFVFLRFGVVDVALAGAESRSAFHQPLFAKKIGGLDGIGFIGGAEDHPVPEIQGGR